jgi:LPXTG-motif cell wall-anchored protein
MEERRELPDTSANWVLLMLGGGLLSGAGLTAFRRR